MAIVHARVDERLIHGQVAMVWTNTLGATRIIVANNEAVKDDMIIAGLKMAKPAGVRLSILSLKRAAEKFAEKGYEEDKVFLITKSIGDMAALIRSGVPIKEFNVGNVAKREGSRPVKKSVNLTEADIKDIREMTDMGVSVTAQMLPNESDQSILNML
ncbi:PTS sugar transporter subunit IIB [Lachnospiraceae bacterium 54-53]